MDEQQRKEGEQSALWNGTGGRGWVALEDVLDQTFQPFDDLLMDAVSSERTSRVLDVGCGAGGTTVAVARSQGANGGCTGIGRVGADDRRRARARLDASASPWS